MTKKLKPKKVTLDVIFYAITGLDGRIMSLEKSFESLEGRFDSFEKSFDSFKVSVNNRFDKVESDIKDLKDYVDDEISSLAGMVQRGFEEQSKMFVLRSAARVH